MKIKQIKIMSLSLRCIVTAFLLLTSVIIIPVYSEISVNLTWDAYSNPNIQYYKVHWGTVSRNTLKHPVNFAYENATEIAISPEPQAIIDDLNDNQKYFFAVTCVMMDGTESGYSNEISFGANISTSVEMFAKRPSDIRISNITVNFTRYASFTLFSSVAIEDANANIYDTNGKLLYVLPGRNGKVSWHVDDTPGISAGTYLFEIKSEKAGAGIIHRGRIIIIR